MMVGLNRVKSLNLCKQAEYKKARLSKNLQLQFIISTYQGYLLAQYSH